MSIHVECDRIDCGVSFEVGMEGDWSHAPKNVSDYALQGLEYSDLLYLYMPEGWKVDRVGFDSVIHCPDHAGS